LPGHGTQNIQPIHVDDLAAGVAALLTSRAAHHCFVPFVGPVPHTLREFLRQLRASMQLDEARFIPIPLGVMRIASRLTEIMPGSLLDRETLEMLLRGNVGDPSALRRLLGRELLRPDQFVCPSEAAIIRTSAQVPWLMLVLRTSVALVWIGSGIVSFGLFPTTSSYQLLARVGVGRDWAPVLLYGASIFDVLLGVATLVMRQRTYLWVTQIMLILFYTAIISIRLPEFWLHPYGPVLKNMPMLAAIIVLYVLERR
jgi:uncharacterized membrane protein YphA (DoxX/SURF4 family)